MSAILWLAAVYNIVWAAGTIAVPNLVFEQVGMPPPTPIEFWLGISALVGVFGVGYGIAATAPYKHWAVVLMGLLSKLAATGGMAAAVATKALPMKFGYLTLANDVLWLLPFAIILHGAWRARHPKAVSPSSLDAASAAGVGADEGVPGAPSMRGEDVNLEYRAAEAAALGTITRQATLYRGHMLSALSLRELSDKTPALVIFLRHLGCPFCRAALAEIAARRKALEAGGVAVVLVHMAPPLKAAKFFERYGLDEPEGVWHVSDPERRLYQAFELARGRFKQLMGFREIGGGFKNAIIKRHMFAMGDGDRAQLGGAFLFYRRQIVKAFRATRASDAPDLGELGACPTGLVAPAPEAPAAPMGRSPSIAGSGPGSSSPKPPPPKPPTPTRR